MAVIRKSIAKYMELRTAEQVDEIIVHCSATREGRPFGVEDIERWHRERGFAMCGYHFVIALDGEVQPGRPAGYVGAHCEGHNKRSIGVCYIGGLDRKTGEPKDTRTEKQRESMEMLLKHLCRRYHIKRISGHRDYAAKACPCFDAHKEYQHIADGTVRLE